MSVKITAFLVLFGAVLSCRQPSRMWEEHKVPAPDVSWSKTTILSNPELQRGGKLNLDKACEIALGFHPELAKSRGLLDAANARIGETLSAYLPQLKISTSYGTSSPGSTSSYRVGANADQLVTDSGKTDASLNQAKYNALVAAHELEVAAASILLEVRETFLTHLSDKALLLVAEETVASFEKHLKEAEKLLEVGKGTEADVAKARVDLANAKLEFILSKNRVQISRLKLNRSLGLEEDPGYDVASEIPKARFNINLDDAVKQARLDRPEFKVAWDRFRASEESLKKVWSEYFPSISLGLSHDFTGKNFPLIDSWRLGPSLVLTLFNGFLTPERIREAESLLRVNRAELALVEQKIFQEVQTSWLNLQESDERLRLTAETVKAATESLKLISGRYLVGRSTILEQTDAELALSKARAEEIRSRYDYELNVVRLLRAVGIARVDKK